MHVSKPVRDPDESRTVNQAIGGSQMAVLLRRRDILQRRDGTAAVPRTDVGSIGQGFIPLAP